MRKIAAIIDKIVKKVLPQSNDTALDRQIKVARLKRTGAYSATALMALYVGMFVFPPVHDDNTSAVTGTSIASDTTLSIALENSTLSLDLTPTSHSGSFATTSTSAVIKVSTNNITGYTLGIESSNKNAENADKLVNTDTAITTKNTIASLQSAVSLENYQQNNIDNVDLNNTWGYSPSYYNSVQNTNESTSNNPIYYPAPVNGDIINATNAPNPVDDTTVGTDNEELEQDEYTINFGSRIDYSIYSGTYTNPTTFIITAVGNQVPYSVSYNANKPEQAPVTATVDNMPTAQTGSAQGGDTVAVVINTKVPTLGTKNTTDPDNPTYTYAGYVFNGWCSIQPETPATINGQTNTLGYQVCPETATIYQPGDSFGIDQTVDNTQTLYAIWGAPATVTFYSNGLIYNNDTTDTANTVQYIPTYQGGKITGTKTNTIYTGTYKTPAYEETDPITNYILKGWSTDGTAATATYPDEAAITEDLSLTSGDTVELYAIWNYATKITFSKNGADGTETMEPQYIEVGTTVALEKNVYTNTGYILGSWNTVQTPTEENPGETYQDQANFTAGSQSADVMLYAQWEKPLLYNYVKALVKKSGDTELTQSATDLQAEITAPTTTDPATDTSNSGVYKYDATTFGAASDADSSYDIYYYRGILEPTADNGEYGSDGKATTYPNYVKLANNTCWRIVRTTGSGGVKMIYNGKWTGSTCANSVTNANAVSSVYFNRGTTSNTNNYGTRGLVAYVGYNYNSDYGYGGSSANEANSIANSTLFSNSNSNSVVTPSNARTQLESWYNGNITAYTSILETSAGYCNDRATIDTFNIFMNPLTTSTIPYKTSDATVYFVAYIRNMTTRDHPTLGCPNITGQDLLTTSNGLDVPAALLTADEASFAGSGSTTAANGSSYHANSYLCSGNYFWLLSPESRNLSGYDREFVLQSDGSLHYINVVNAFGVRPAISLKPGTTVADGEGTATNPWTIDE